MARKEYTLSTHGTDEVPLNSFLDEFKIDAASFDVMKLKISVDLDWSGVYYEGETPEICVVIEYEDNFMGDQP